MRQQPLFDIKAPRVAYQGTVASDDPVAGDDNHYGIAVVCHANRPASLGVLNLRGDFFIAACFTVGYGA